MIAGFIVEPIQGLMAAVIPLPEGISSRRHLRSARARAGGVCIVDEVQTGFARLGENLFAFDDPRRGPRYRGPRQRAISNGFPLSAVVAKREIAEAMAQRKVLSIPTPRTQYPAPPDGRSCARSTARALQDNARKVGELMMRDLRALQQKYDIIGDVRGKGLMIGVDLVRDRRSKEACRDRDRTGPSSARRSLAWSSASPASTAICCVSARRSAFRKAMSVSSPRSWITVFAAL